MRDYFFITVDSDHGIQFATTAGALSPRFEDAAQFQFAEDAAIFAKKHGILSAKVRELYGA